MKLVTNAGKSCLKVCKTNPIMTTIVVVFVIVVIALSIYGDQIGAYKETNNPQPNSNASTVPQTVQLVQASERQAQVQVEEGFTNEIQSPDELVPKDSNKKTVALFYANWCRYCTRFKPHFETAMAELNGNSNLNLVKVDHDKFDGLSGQYDVKGFPTVVVISSDGTFEHLDCPRDGDFLDCVRKI